MTAIRKTRTIYTLEDYAEMEKHSEERLEYFEGSVWSMAGASPKHEDIVINTATELKNKLRGRRCKVCGSNLRVKVPVYLPYRYPDVTAVCGEQIIENFYDLEILTNPALIVEVLSPSTETFDVGAKFMYYKSIESFREYLLISQDQPRVVLYTKRDERIWLHQEFNRLDETIHLSSLDCEVSMAEIYLDVEFEESARPRFPHGAGESR